MDEKKTTAPKILKVEPNNLHKQLLINKPFKKPDACTKGTFRLEQSSLLNRVKNFLPELISANEKLSLMEQKDKDNLDIENTVDCEKIIEMNISVVDNELLVSDDEGSSSSDSSDEDSDDDGDNNNRSKVLKKKTPLVQEIDKTKKIVALKMAEVNMKDWINIADTKQFDLIWAFRNYQSPKYLFAEDYDRDKIKTKILESHRVKDTIEKRKRESGIDASQSLQEAAAIIDEIAHTFSLTTIRFMAFSLIKIIKQLFQRVLVNKEGIEQFNEISKCTPVVLVPTHSSYFDFLLASAICFAMDLPLPAIVAGQDFLNIAVVNHLLRGSGAFYMRRSFASDMFYRSIFTEYVQQILSIGDRPIEFFPEGTRSRSGKALQPKLGLLSMVLESCFHGFVQDVSFIPMSISYEKITEEMLYAFELVGIPKPKESLSGLLKARSVLTTDYGTVCVTFGEPMSLRKYCGGKIDGMDYVRIPRCERHLKIFGREAQEMKIAKYFGEKLIFTQQQNLVIYPRAVVTYILMSQQNDNINIKTLAFQVDKVGYLLKQLGFRIYGFEDLLTNEKAILQAVKFSDMVLQVDPTEERITCTRSAFTDPKLHSSALYKAFGKDEELLSKSLAYIYSSCQRNKLIHPCLLPSLLLHAVKGTNTTEECKRSFCFLRQMLKIEFIFDPDTSAETNFDSTLSLLVSIGILTRGATSHNIQLNTDRMEEVQFLLDLVQPFIDAYMIVLVSFLHDTYEYPTHLKSMTSLLQLQAAKFIKSVQIMTFEALCLQTLTNIVTSFCKNGQLKTIKNEKFQTLVDGVNLKEMSDLKVSLAPFVSEEIAHRLIRSKL